MCVGRDRFFRKLSDHRLVGLDGRFIRTLLLSCQSNVKLRPRRVLSVRRRPDNGRENLRRSIHRRSKWNAEKLQFLAGEIDLTDPELRFDCFVEVRAARILFHHPAKQLRRRDKIVPLFQQLRRAKNRSRRKRILGMASHQGLVGPNRSFQVPLFFCDLPDVKKFLCIAIHLFLARRHVLGFFTWLKDHRSGAQVRKSKTGDDDEKKCANSEIHEDWQGS